MTRLGDLVRTARKAQGLDQKALAQAVRTSPATLSRIEAGRQLPNVVVLDNLARVLTLDVTYLLTLAAAERAPARGGARPAGGSPHADRPGA